MTKILFFSLYQHDAYSTEPLNLHLKENAAGKIILCQSKNGGIWCFLFKKTSRNHIVHQLCLPWVCFIVGSNLVGGLFALIFFVWFGFCFYFLANNSLWGHSKYFSTTKQRSQGWVSPEIKEDLFILVQTLPIICTSLPCSSGTFFFPWHRLFCLLQPMPWIQGTRGAAWCAEQPGFVWCCPHFRAWCGKESELTLYIQFGTVIFPGECLSAGIFIACLVPWRATEDTHKKKKSSILFFQAW